MARNATKTKQMPPGAALIALQERPYDASLLAAIVGKGHVKTHAEVGKAFGITPATVRQSWALAGMPGASGRYPLAEIAAWRLKHLDNNRRRRGETSGVPQAELKRQLAEAEVKKMQLQAERLEREEDEARADLIRRSEVIATWQQHIGMLRERLCDIPDLIAPQLPVSTAPELVEDIRRVIHRSLLAYVELGSKALRIEDA